MTYRIASLLAVLSVLTLEAPSSADAQSLEQGDEDVQFDEAEQAAAKRAFSDGRAAFDSGQYKRALERFEHAYALSQKSELLFNIGLAADRLRNDDRALEAFEQYLEETPESSDRDEVQMRVVALREAQAKKEGQAHSTERAPSPAEVARANEPERDVEPSPFSSTRRERERERDDESSVLGSWWFWTGAAVLAIAGGATAYVLLQPDDQAALPAPNTGVTVPTLRLAP